MCKYKCDLCAEADAKHDVLPDGAHGDDSYLRVCDKCVARAKTINQWKESKA